MRTITMNVCTYDELSDDAKSAARDWYENTVAPDVAYELEEEAIGSYMDFWSRNIWPWMYDGTDIMTYVKPTTYGTDTYQLPYRRDEFAYTDEIAAAIRDVLEQYKRDGYTVDIDTDENPILYEDTVMDDLEISCAYNDGLYVSDGMSEAFGQSVDLFREILGRGLPLDVTSKDLADAIVDAIFDAAQQGIDDINGISDDVYDIESEEEDIRANEWEFYEDGRPFGGRAA
jgi:hypothetical protein